MDELRIGLTVENGCTRVADFEDLGVDSLWVGSHLADPAGHFDGIVQLARLAACTQRVEIGITALVLCLYQPAVIAKQMLDLDAMSAGRVRLGIGVGGEHPEEFRAVGVPLVARGARTDEALGLLRQFWTNKEITFQGRYYNIDRVALLPIAAQKAGPPVLISGRKDAAMRRAALRGDGWLPYLYSASRYGASVQRIKEVAAATGRSLEGFDWSVHIFVRVSDDPAEANRELARELQLGFQQGQDFAAMISRVAVVGTRQEVTARLQQYVDAGARHLHLACMGANQYDQSSEIVDKIVPNLRVHD